MMKLFTILTTAIFILSASLHAQPWYYGFGTGTGVYTSTTPSTTFLPIPPTDSARVRIGAGGSFNLENQNIPFGSQTYLRIAASSSGSVNKFSVYNYTPTKSATIRFKVRFGAANGSPGITTGIWQFALGDGASYSDNNGFNGNHVFAGLQFTFSSAGISTQYRNNSNNWSNVGLSGIPFIQGQDYIVEIYANNTTSIQNYTYGTTKSVLSGTWDLWVDGTLVGDDLSKAILPLDSPIDSWMFIGLSSTGNVANIFIDEIYYSNNIEDIPLPVTLSSFSLIAAGRNAVLNWVTENELNNAGFVIERRSVYGTELSNWERIGFATGKGTVNTPQTYSYTDPNLKAGNYEYRLKQTDYNGNFEYFQPNDNRQITIKTPGNFEIMQNYPNPSNPNSKIDYELPFDANVTLEVFDLAGKTVKVLVNNHQKADYYSVSFDGSGLASGVYFYRISADGNKVHFSKTLKMLLIK